MSARINQSFAVTGGGTKNVSFSTSLGVYTSTFLTDDYHLKGFPGSFSTATFVLYSNADVQLHSTVYSGGHYPNLTDSSSRALDVVSVTTTQSQVTYTESGVAKHMFWDIARGRYYEDVFSGAWTVAVSYTHLTLPTILLV